MQRGFTAPMKEAGAAAGDYHRMQAWAGQAAALATEAPAGELLARIWREAEAIFRDA